MKVDTKHFRGSSGRGVGRPLGKSMGREIFLNFKVKNARFYAFLLLKTILVATNWDQGGLIDPWRLKMQNARGLKT